MAGLNTIMPETVLLVSSAKGQQALGPLLQAVARPRPQVFTAAGGAEARRLLLAQDFDTVIINAGRIWLCWRCAKARPACFCC